mgnify:CR=1 FL=1
MNLPIVGHHAQHHLLHVSRWRVFSYLQQLLVKRFLRDLAAFKIKDQSALRAQKSIYSLLPILVPLPADHDAVAVGKWHGAGDEIAYYFRFKSADALKQIPHLLQLDALLRLVVDVLILASAAFTEVLALGIHAIG